MAETVPTNTERTNRLKLIWGIISLAGPTALWIVVGVLFAVSNYTLGYTYDDETAIIRTALSVIGYLLAVVAFLTWLPGIIVGIILLVTRK
jgi:hypothetical protein